MTDVFMSRPAHRLLVPLLGGGHSCKSDFVRSLPQMNFPARTICPGNPHRRAYGKAGIWDAGCAQAGRDGASPSSCLLTWGQS